MWWENRWGKGKKSEGQRHTVNTIPATIVSRFVPVEAVRATFCAGESCDHFFEDEEVEVGVRSMMYCFGFCEE